MSRITERIETDVDLCPVAERLSMSRITERIETTMEFGPGLPFCLSMSRITERIETHVEIDPCFNQSEHEPHYGAD